MLFALLPMLLVATRSDASIKDWCIGPFFREDTVNPILAPMPALKFHCPMRNQDTAWAHDNVFNPAATVHANRIVVLFRAEDDSGEGIGSHTSRVGLASTSDGTHFEMLPTPVLFPANDDQKQFDWPGGCEDPRIVESDSGFVLTYTAWNRRTARLSVAISTDLVHWTKLGPAFARASGGKFLDSWSKSGAIVTTQHGDHLVAAKIDGKYWMYWGEGKVYAAWSTNLADWSPVVDAAGNPQPILEPRSGLFDSDLTESGPPAVLTRRGIVLIYNGKNAAQNGDPSISPGAYSAGEALFSKTDPTKLLDRTEHCFLKPERPYEATGQYRSGTVFVEGLVHFKRRWRLFYGTADSKVAVASTK